MNENIMNYTIHWTDRRPSFQQWENDPVWQKAEAITLDQSHPQSSNHRPKTEVRVLYDTDNLYVLFRVQDRYVKAVYTNYQDPVCNDSCVEFFLMPCIFSHEPFQTECPSYYQGYFNIEVNCIGTMLIYYIEDWRRIADGFVTYTPVQEDFGQKITIFHSIPEKIEHEIEIPTEWIIGYALPFSVLEHYLGALDIRIGKSWRANFYKCGDQTSHPHWASWAPIGQELNFHQPEYFGTLEFGV